MTQTYKIEVIDTFAEANLEELYEAAKTADDAWHDALVAVYGKDACNARYDSKRNQATPTLIMLREWKMIAWQKYKQASDSLYNVNA